jgi:tRNA (cmo5U34)-methyltransferase
MTLEEMGSFFDARTEGYEAHMLNDLAGAENYRRIAALIPPQGQPHILDLGCGTGLELDEIFKVNPGVRVTGIDLAEKMLEKLKQKHAARLRQLHIILADYMKYDFGQARYDVVLSAQTLHHFTHEEKAALYRRLHACLKPAGLYIEADYVAEDQATEDRFFAEKKRRLAEQGNAPGFYHIDTPCTVDNQLKLLRAAGFVKPEVAWEKKHFVIIEATRI